jgi:hypothetical protein
MESNKTRPPTRDVKAWITDTVSGGLKDVTIDYISAWIVQENDGSTSVTVTGQSVLQRERPLWTSADPSYRDSDYFLELAASERVTRDAHVVAERCSTPAKR